MGWEGNSHRAQSRSGHTQSSRPLDISFSAKRPDSDSQGHPRRSEEPSARWDARQGKGVGPQT